ncbi:hypothetical protein J4734_29245 [Klebsiella pneumoniae]|uniref:Uncharacterized protein n=1 Tax=Klebsiella pneumoniae TaxID=573 RepID=A0A939NQF0_KLEPN|nr:hypothetical protein [Klebsiella pneumoniae]
MVQMLVDPFGQFFDGLCLSLSPPELDVQGPATVEFRPIAPSCRHGLPYGVHFFISRTGIRSTTAVISVPKQSCEYVSFDLMSHKNSFSPTIIFYFLSLECSFQYSWFTRYQSREANAKLKPSIA